MRRNILAGNWKMNTRLSEGLDLFDSIATKTISFSKQNIQFIIAPPYTHLANMNTKNYTNLSLAAQNCSSNVGGAFTGEVSAEMIKSVGARSIIIGHSEMRKHFQETSIELKMKVDVAIKNGLNVIYCCGETEEERNNNMQEEVVKDQISNVLFDLSTSDFGKIIVAYEPVWAIGTGNTATPDQAQNIHAFIRRLIAVKYNPEVAESTSILYGGSCNTKNAKDLFKCKDIDGGLIGGASLNSIDFIQIANDLATSKI